MLLLRPALGAIPLSQMTPGQINEFRYAAIQIPFRVIRVHVWLLRRAPEPELRASLLALRHSYRTGRDQYKRLDAPVLVKDA